jgi:hypothetical protein
LGSGSSFFSPAVGGAAGASNDIRTEIFSPPYALDTTNAPSITGVGSNTDLMTVTTVTYGEALTVTWAPKDSASPDAGSVQVTSATLVAPSTVTHGFNNNQRVVYCEITESGAGQLSVQMPPNPRVAPPQMYLLFLNNAKTYSQAWWVHLQAGPAAAASSP